MAPLTLILGDEELLVSRAIAGIVAATRAADAEADVRDLTADAVEAGALAELLSPSLFGGTTVLVVRGAQDLAEDARDLLARYAADAEPDTVLVIAHSGVTKGKKLVDAMQAAKCEVVRCAKLTKPPERRAFVEAEIRAAGRRATAGACQVLVDAVGNDLRELAAAAAQLVSDTAGSGVIDETLVARFHRGKAETSSFAIADAAVSGNTVEAMTLLRQAMETGTADLLIVSALGGAVRELANVRGAGGSNAGAIARQLGLPPWKVEKALRSSRGWTDLGLSTALRAVAEADLSVKGAGASAGYALERAVLAVARARAA